MTALRALTGGRLTPSLVRALPTKGEQRYPGEIPAEIQGMAIIPTLISWIARNGTDRPG